MLDHVAVHAASRTRFDAPAVAVVSARSIGAPGLAAEYIAAQERERVRIARELHDVIGQALTAVKLSLQSLDRTEQVAAWDPAIDASIATVDEALDQVRTLAFDLRPGILDDVGLEATVRWYCRRTAAESGLAIRLWTRGVEQRLPAEIETTCFRILQEAITNVIRHAGARRIRVRLLVDDRRSRLELRVADDGMGFDTLACGDARCMGIEGMRERAALVAGTLRLRSMVGAGTRVSVSLPIPGPR